MRWSRGIAGSLLVLAAAGCAGTTPPAASPPPPSTAPASDVWHQRETPAEAAKQAGSPDTCSLPVAFDVARSWEFQPAAESPRQGLTLSCVIKESAAKGGFLRAWVGSEPGTSPRAALDKFLSGEGTITDPQYRDTDVGMGDGVEVTYLRDGVRGRAFAMSTPLRSVVVSAMGADAGDFDLVLPGYLLAKDTLTPTER